MSIMKEIQQDAQAWRLANFRHDTVTTQHQLLGVVEEVGELAHAVLKRAQGVRGSEVDHSAEIRDAVGDIVIFLMGVCSCEGFSLEDQVRRTWLEVAKRNWVENPTTGITDERAAGAAGE